MSELTIFFLGQSIIIVGAILTAYVAIRVQIAKLQVEVTHLKSDHGKLAKKLDGVSRHLAELTGRLSKE